MWTGVVFWLPFWLDICKHTWVEANSALEHVETGYEHVTTQNYKQNNDWSSLSAFKSTANPILICRSKHQCYALFAGLSAGLSTRSYSGPYTWPSTGLCECSMLYTRLYVGFYAKGSKGSKGLKDYNLLEMESPSYSLHATVVFIQLTSFCSASGQHVCRGISRCHVAVCHRPAWGHEDWVW